jgi:gas vesicle protein
MSEQNQGSFIGGLALGMFAGAAGYFMFATKDGSKFRKKIEQEWQEAKVSLAEEGVIKNKDITISELVSDWLGLDHHKTTTKKKTPTSKPEKTSKFKGV